MINTIIHNITTNDKRMAKLRSLKKGVDVRDKAKAYVIGEAATLKIKLTDEEARRHAVQIMAAL